MDTVWFVDDLPRNLRKFEDNHRDYFKVKTFSKIDEVLDRNHKKDYPDALLCDVFFYDSVEEAEQVEAEIENLAKQLKETAQRNRLLDHRHAVGIQLMKKIYEFFGNNRRHFRCMHIHLKALFCWSKVNGTTYPHMAQKFC